MPKTSYRFQPTDIDTQQFLNALKRWVEIESPSHDRDAVNKMVDHVQAYATAAGLVTKRMSTGDSWGDVLLVRNRPIGDRSADRVVLLAHLDTVHAVGTLDGPLPWREEGDRIYGPGIYDMKSGGLMAIEALARVSNDAAASIVFTPDEETGTIAGRPYVEQYTQHAHAVLVMEPARDGGKIVIGRRGSASYQYKITGKAAHSGTNPQHGRSAIHEAALLILRLESLNDPNRGVGINVGVIQGGTTRNTVPAQCVLDVDIRLPDLEAQKDIIAKLESMRPQGQGITYEISGVVSRPPFAPDAGIQALFNRAQPIAEAMGYPLVPMLSGGGSDGNFTAALGIPTLDGLGPDGGQAHTMHEHIYPASIAPRLAMLCNLIIDLQNG